MYDIIIIGGGIAGLNIAKQFSDKFPTKKILLLEKEKSLGGKIHTYEDKNMRVEEGASRFNENHKNIFSIINELDLSDKIMKIENKPLFLKEKKIYDSKIIDDIYLKIFKKTKKENIDDLQKINLSKYLENILSKTEYEYFTEAFGYCSELILMNAYDALKLLKELNGQFYFLQGGLSQIIKKLKNKILENKNCRIITNSKVIDLNVFQKNGEKIFEIQKKSSYSEKIISYFSKICVFSIPKDAFEPIPFFKELTPLLSNIHSSSLCRIYSKYEEDENGKYWFSNMTKMVTDSRLKIVIPIGNEKKMQKNDGVIMVSYTDGKHANYWEKIYEKNGIDGLNKSIKKEIKKTLGIEVPLPKFTNIFFWRNGVGYWGINADSENISKKIKKPNDELELYICGENYSYEFQQWIEGALETSNDVFLKIIEKNYN